MSRLILVIALVCTTTLHAQDGDAIPFEGRIVYDLNHITSQSVTDASVFVSDALLPVGLAVPTVLYVGGLLAPESADARHAAESGVQIGVSLGVTYAAVAAVKAIVDRDRPFEAFPGLITNRYPGGKPLGASFPSGHSAGAAVLATSLSLCYPEWYVIVPSAAFALWTGFARMNLGVHYLTDVLAGYALGAGIAYGVHQLRSQLFDVTEPFLPAAGNAPSRGTIGIGMRGSTPLFNISLSF